MQIDTPPAASYCGERKTRRPVQVCTSLLSRARISEGEELEVGGGERGAGRHLGELHLRLAAKAVGIEVDRTARLIVDDPLLPAVADVPKLNALLLSIWRPIATPLSI